MVVTYIYVYELYICHNMVMNLVEITSWIQQLGNNHENILRHTLTLLTMSQYVLEGLTYGIQPYVYTSYNWF